MKVKDSSTIVGASAFLNYNNNPNLIGGVRYDNGTHKSVYLGVGLEMLDDSTMRREFLKTAHDWFYETTSGLALDQLFKDFKFYPNPVNDFLNLDLSHLNEMITLSVYDIKGQLVLNKQITNSYSQLDVRGFKRGSYLMEVKNIRGDRLSIKKIEIN